MDTPQDLPTWLNLATPLGFAGLVWYFVVYTLPRNQERADEHNEKIQERFIKQLEDLQTTFKKEQEEQQRLFREQLQSLLIEFKNHSLAQNEKHEKTILLLTASQEKQLDRVIDKFASCNRIANDYAHLREPGK